MPNAYDFFLRGDPDVVRYQLVEVTHPSWQHVYRYVQNAVDGLTVSHENGDKREYQYSPLTIKKSKSDDSLDQSITIGVGDLGELLPCDIDRLRNSEQYKNIKPTLNYREYLSSDLSSPLLSVLGLEVTDYQPNKEGGVFECRAKQMNLTKTGISYSINDFAALRDTI